MQFLLTEVPAVWMVIMAAWGLATGILGALIAFIHWRRHILLHGFFIGDTRFVVYEDTSYGTEMGSMLSANRERGVYW